MVIYNYRFVKLKEMTSKFSCFSIKSRSNYLEKTWFCSSVNVDVSQAEEDTLTTSTGRQEYRDTQLGVTYTVVCSTANDPSVSILENINR